MTKFNEDKTKIVDFLFLRIFESVPFFSLQTLFGVAMDVMYWHFTSAVHELGTQSTLKTDFTQCRQQQVRVEPV